MTDKIFQLKIDPDTEEKLKKLAESSERTKSAMVRWLISREFSRQFEPHVVAAQGRDGVLKVDSSFGNTPSGKQEGRPVPNEQVSTD